MTDTPKQNAAVKDDSLPAFDMATWPTEQAVKYMMEELGAPESRARFMVAMAKGEITGDVLAEGDLPEPAKERPAA